MHGFVQRTVTKLVGASFGEMPQGSAMLLVDVRLKQGQLAL